MSPLSRTDVILNVLGRSIGDKSIRALEVAARQQRGSVRDLGAAAHLTLDADLFMQAARYQLPALHRNAQHGVAQLADVLAWLERLVTTVPLDEVITTLIKRIDYRAHLVPTYGPAAAEERLENVLELVTVAVGVRELPVAAQLGQFLEDVALMTDGECGEASAESVTCITLHRAKGLEWHTVFLPGVEDDFLPHINAQASDAEIEEERRLLYVGVSRAREHLYLLHTWRRTIFGKTVDRSRSRFLDALPDGHIH